MQINKSKRIALLQRRKKNSYGEEGRDKDEKNPHFCFFYKDECLDL